MNTQKLMTLIKINEETKKFYLGEWIGSCGTYGCLVGNYLIAHNQTIEHMIYKHDLLNNITPEVISYKAISKEFNITYRETIFLFSPWNYQKGKYGITSKAGDMRNPYDRIAAINRVRKFLYYKLHKQEMIYDEKGVKDSARRAEGNQMVLQKVLEKVNV